MSFAYTLQLLQTPVRSHSALYLKQVELGILFSRNRLIASLLSRGAARLRYKGWYGACVQVGMAIMAHNAATVRRIHLGHLTARAHKFRRLLYLTPPNLLKNKEEIN
jgi:hypothetical protein